MNYPFLLTALFLYMNLWFLFSLIKKRNDIVDIAWGLGFTFLAWLSYLTTDITNLRGFIITILVSIWGLRLAWHIHLRNKGKTEDYRYLNWRNTWGKWFLLRSYFQIYMLQGLLLFLIILPVLFTHTKTLSLFTYYDIIGITVWITGFLFESIGDAQLAKFIKNPKNKGKIMESGLWKYTRHPNYFGEVCLWWGIWIISLSVYPQWISILGPLTITILILKVSGIPMLEEKLSQKPGFKEYEKRVSKFIPLPQKKK